MNDESGTSGELDLKAHIRTVPDFPVPGIRFRDITPLLANFFELNLLHYDARNAGNPLKQWLVYLRGYFPQAALLFEQIKRLRAPEDIRSILQQALPPIAAKRCAA